MEPNERLELTVRDLDRLRILNQVREGRLTQPLAAQQLDLSSRQVRRLCARLRDKGPKGVIHGLRGRQSNHQLPPGRVDTALSLFKKHYDDFGPTFACEKMAERDGIVLGISTLRRALVREGLWRPRRQKIRHHAWRARKACVGELVQVDGSIHDWFEGRGPKCWFIPYVDDATSEVLWGEFANAEDTLTLMRLSREYLKRRGRPLAFYVDKDSIYKTTRNASIDEQLRDEQPMTQFTRAMSELDIRVICAHSPQAKGRVERGFKTHQDRLVKELRLAGISDISAANRFLREVYIPAHNKRFGRPPANRTDAHRPILRGQMLDRVLCLRTPRVLANDFTIRWKPGFLQLLENQPITVKPGQRIDVEVRLDRSVHLRHGDDYLAYKTIAKRPYKAHFAAQPSQARNRLDPRLKGVGPIPAKNHPWRRLFLHGPYKVNIPANGTQI
jgi:hypothetical protein